MSRWGNRQPLYQVGAHRMKLASGTPHKIPTEKVSILDEPDNWFAYG